MFFNKPAEMRSGKITEKFDEQKCMSICSTLRYLSQNSYNDGDEYPFIASDPHYIKKAIYAVLNLAKRKRKKLKIVDAGCGISPFLMYLTDRNNLNYIHSLTGIEKNKNILKVLEKSNFKYHDYRVEFLEGDLLDLKGNSKEVISQADFIYTYQPIRDDAMYIDFIKSTWNLMKPKAQILDPYGPINYAINRKYLNKVTKFNYSVYIKD